MSRFWRAVWWIHDRCILILYALIVTYWVRGVRPERREPVGSDSWWERFAAIVVAWSLVFALAIIFGGDGRQ